MLAARDWTMPVGRLGVLGSCKPPRTTGRRKSPCSKPTSTSSSICGSGRRGPARVRRRAVTIRAHADSNCSTERRELDLGPSRALRAWHCSRRGRPPPASRRRWSGAGGRRSTWWGSAARGPRGSGASRSPATNRVDEPRRPAVVLDLADVVRAVGAAAAGHGQLTAGGDGRIHQGATLGPDPLAGARERLGQLGGFGGHHRVAAAVDREGQRAGLDRRGPRRTRLGWAGGSWRALLSASRARGPTSEPPPGGRDRS